MPKIFRKVPNTDTSNTISATTCIPLRLDEPFLMNIDNTYRTIPIISPTSVITPNVFKLLNI